MSYLTYDEEYIDDTYKDAEWESGDEQYDAFRQQQIDDERAETQRNRRANDYLSEALKDIGSGLDRRPWS